MKADPILEELWRVKDDLAREAGYNIDCIFDELRTAETRHPGPLIRSADDLQRYVAEEEHRHSLTTALALKESKERAENDHQNID